MAGGKTIRESSAEKRLEGFAKRVILALAWVAPCLILLAALFQHNFNGLYRADAMEAAQVARNVSEGRGFTTAFVRPLSLAYHPGLEKHPDLYQPPLYPLVLGFLFCIFPTTDTTVALASAGFFLLTILMTFLLARRLFGRETAILSALLLGLNLTLLEMALSGTALPLWAFLVTLLFFLLSRFDGRPRAAAGIGAVFGLCFLAEYATLALLPAVAGLLIVFGRPRKWAGLGLFALGGLLVFAPWGVRNYLVAGSPWFSLREYAPALFGVTYPQYSVFREMSAAQSGPWGFFLSHPGEMARKFIGGSRALYSGLPVVCGLYVLPFFIAGMLRRFTEGRLAGLRGGLYASLLLLAVGAALTTGAADLFAPLAPLIIIFAAAFFWRLLQAQERRTQAKALAIGLLLLAAALPALVNLVSPPEERGPARDNIRLMARALPADAVVATDIPWAVAWYANRTSVWLPNSPQEGDPTRSAAFVQVDGRERRVKAIFLSSSILSYSTAEKLVGWQRLRAAPQGFRLKAVFPGRELLLTREVPSDNTNKGP